MGISSIQHNMLMANVGRHMNVNTSKRAKTAEKLSSGYKINRAADDAAGLSMSEKMRFMIRGLDQGTENVMDGISWVQIGDGSLEEAHGMLHRMTELAIKSSNGTYTDDDRAMMQAEFAQLQKEIDRLTDTTTFNEQHIFQEHEWPYHEIEGSTRWSPTETHTVREGENDLVITYALNENDPLETVSIKVAAGTYTTKELVDEIDTALEEAGLLEKGIRFSYDAQGFCNLDLEGGRIIDGVTGGLSYLLYDNYGGGSLGALIGTTRYTDDSTPRLYIQEGKNNVMTFQVISPEKKEDGTLDAIPVTVKLTTGTYSKNQLIQDIKAQIEIQAPGRNIIVEPQPDGSSIRVSSPDYIISEFEGNMFTIDGGLYTSVFYDNIKYSTEVKRYPAELQGGYVVRDQRALPSYDPEGSTFHFKQGVNDKLVLNPNGRGKLEIDMMPMDGKNIDAVVNYLQDQFKAFTWQDEDGVTQTGAGLKVDKVYPDYYTTVYNANGTTAGSSRMAGIRIVSTEMGPESTIGIDKAASTAFDTLFTARRVTNYSADATFGGNDGTPDSNDSLVGLRNLSGGFKAETGKSDSFEIQIDSGDWKTVTVAQGDYTAGTLASAIQGQLDTIYGTNKLIVTNASNTIKIEAADSDIKGIQLRAHTETDGTTNIGYQEIFQSVTYKPEISRDGYSGLKQGATILLPEVKELKDGKITIDSTYGNLVVRVDESQTSYYNHSVNLTGSWTLAELKTKIENAMPAKEEPIKFNALDDHGYTRTITAASSVVRTGQTLTNASASYYGSRTGYTPPGEGGDMAMEGNKPAVLTFATALGEQVSISDANKDFVFTLNGNRHQIDLKTAIGAGTYSRADFVAKLQDAVTAELGGTAPDAHGGMKVALANGNKLELTAGLNLDGGGVWPGGATDIALEVTQKGGFVYNLHDNSQPAVAKLTASSTVDKSGVSNPSPTINNGFTGSGTLDLKLEKPGGTTQDISVTINGATSRSNLESQLNNYFKDNNINLSATVYSDELRITTTGDWKGDDYKLTIDTSAGKSSIKEKLFGNANDNYTMETKTGISVTTSAGMQTAPIVFANDQSFQISVDGSPIKATIKAGTYNTWDDMKDEIQRAVGSSVTVTRNAYGQLTFTTASKNGANSKISLSYQDNSALRTIFGTTKIPGVTADFITVEQDDAGNPTKVQLQLTRKPYDAANTEDKGKIYVESNVQNSTTHKAGSFIMPTPNYTSPSPKEGHHSEEHSFMQGAKLKTENSKVEINQYNKELNFYFSENYGITGNTPQLIHILMDDGSYTPEELRDALQEKLNEQTNGEQKMEVSLSQNGGLLIQSVKAGRKYRIHTDTETASLRPSGGFYDKILCGNEMTNQTVDLVEDKDGRQDGGQVYAMGRQDVKNKITRIQKDGNDELSLKFTTPTGEYRLEMVLDPGYYNSDELVKQIQLKLDEALEKKNLPKGLVEAVVGYQDPDTNIIGAIDDRALAFKLSDNVAAPQDGKYVIEAIGGTAAFSVFYQTEGDIARAYVMGGQDITKGVQIKEGQTGLSVDVDGDTYEIELDPGYYATADDLVRHINEKLKEADAPLKAYEDGGRLKLMHSKYGKHTINHLAGSVKSQLFFSENGEWAGNQPMRLRASGASGDWIEVDKPWMDTVSLGINTLTIEKFKNAQKAITRLKAAVTKVSEVRSYFGALQNRLESTVRNNRNKSENTTAAESRLRDADFSKEVVDNSIHNILEQAGSSLMAQVMQNSNLALQLLQ